MDFNAFDAGISPGGLRNTSEIKILICYLLDSIDSPIERQQMNEIMQEYGLANYFEVNQALSELLANQSIAAAGEGSSQSYTILPKGRDAAETLESTLPISVREKAVQTAIQLLTRIRRERENHVQIIPNGSGYTISCSMMDGKTEFFGLNLYVSDILQAELMKKQLLDNPAGLYHHVVGFMLPKPEEKPPKKSNE